MEVSVYVQAGNEAQEEGHSGCGVNGCHTIVSVMKDIREDHGHVSKALVPNSQDSKFLFLCFPSWPVSVLSLSPHLVCLMLPSSWSLCQQVLYLFQICCLWSSTPTSRPAPCCSLVRPSVCLSELLVSTSRNHMAAESNSFQ